MGDESRRTAPPNISNEERTPMNTTTIDSARRRTDIHGGSDSEAPPTNEPGSPVAERAAAQARYEAFVSAGAEDPQPCPYDQFLPDSALPAALFRREENDVDEVDVADVRQGTLGDCYLMASLAALARTPEGRAVIRGAIVENTNDAGQVVSYTVTLHKPQTNGGSTTFTPFTVTVDGTSLGCGHARARAGADHSYRETWPLVIEEAYAQTFGGYEAIGRGGYAAPAMQVLTGVPAVDHSSLSHYSASALESDVASGKMVVFGTLQQVTMPRLEAGHAYAATATAHQNGTLMVTLHNPWADVPDLVVRYDDVRSSLSFIDVGSPR
jgi:Calpain family cysteine protease